MKNVNIFGCCCSRNIFNYLPIKEFFTVKRYAFQVCMWAYFEPSLDIPDELLRKTQQAGFTLRMLDYDMNKVTLCEFDKVPADYFVLDFMNMSFPLYKVSYKGRETYMQNAFAVNFFKSSKNVKGFEDFTFELVSLSSVPEEKILNGLDRLAEWLLSRYKPEQIILYHPVRATEYVGLSGKKYSYPDKLDPKYNDSRHLLLTATDEFESIVEKYTKYFSERVKGCVVIDAVKPLAFDKLLKDSPAPSMHYAPSTYVAQGEKILDALGISYNKDLKWDRVFLDYQNKIKQEQDRYDALMSSMNNTFIDMNINVYFKIFFSLVDKNDYILFVMCKEDMSILYSDFVYRDKLNMKTVPNFKDSYIAVVDLASEQTFEMTSASLISFNYVNKALSDRPVELKSAGTNCIQLGENVIASAVINNTEYAFNSRGCNIVIYQKSKKAVVDSFVCDLNRDKTLTVRSRYAQNYVQRILNEI